MSVNFQVKQIGRFWRVVGIANKLYPEKHLLKQKALVQLKVELEKALQERRLMPLLKAIEQLNEVDHGKENAEGQRQGREGLLIQPTPINKKKKKKSRKANLSLIMDKHGL